MPRYQLIFSKSAKQDVDKLDSVSRQRMAKKLQYFLKQDDPLAFAHPLVHSKIGSYRFRIGHYRVAFDVHGNDLQVLSVKHRKDVYRG